MFTPSPLLELARSEREIPPIRPRRRRRAASEPAAPDTTADDDGIQRTVRIHGVRLATTEELLRAQLRNAEARRPREMSPTRLLVRSALVQGATRRQRTRARALLGEQRQAVAACLIDDQSSRTDVILRTPWALVLEQAARTGAVDYSVSVRFGTSGPSGSSGSSGSSRPPSIVTDPPVHDATRVCLQTAMTPPSGRAPRGVTLRISAFSQQAFGHGSGGGLHRQLANEAATLGWLHFERREYADALAYFEDAYWLYARPEYRLLEGMVHHQLGRPNAALRAYGAYVDARPDAPETPMLRERIAALERARRRANGSTAAPQL